MTTTQKEILDRVRSKDGGSVKYHMEHMYLVLDGGAVITPEGTLRDVQGNIVTT